MSRELRPGDDAAAALRALARSNLYAFLQRAFPVIRPGDIFISAQYLEAICFALQEVAEGRETRLIISVAPRHLKSICASVILPAFVLGRDPTASVMVVSYGGELARDLGMTFRALVRSDFYRELFPATQFAPGGDRLEEMRTTAGGGRRALTVGGAMTGLGASLIVLDDLIKAGDVQFETARADLRAKFDQSIYSRLNNKKSGAIVSVAQRLHADDITAYLLEKEQFRHLKLDSIAQAEATWPLYRGRTYHRPLGDILNPVREGAEILNQIRAEIGAYAFSAQYLQDPQPGESAFLTLGDLSLVNELPPLNEFPRRIQSWDTAMNDGPRADYSAGLTFGWHEPTGDWYLLDVFEGRLDYVSLKDRVMALRRHWLADRVLIEATALGQPLLQEMKKTARGVFLPVSPLDGKIERFVAQTDWIKAGRLVIPTATRWFDSIRRQLLNFPNTPHDDLVDALVQGIAYIRRHEGAYLDTDPETGRRIGNYRRNPPRREDRMKF